MARTVTCPLAVNLTALESRFKSTWRKRISSLRTQGRDVHPAFRRPDGGSGMRPARRTSGKVESSMARGSSSSRFRANLPASMQEMSSKSFTSRSNNCPLLKASRRTSLLFGSRAQPIEHQFSETEDGIQRSAQIVRNLGQEFVLDCAGFGQLHAGLLQFLVQCLQMRHGGAEIRIAH